jgi:hypothetical protein
MLGWVNNALSSPKVLPPPPDKDEPSAKRNRSDRSPNGPTPIPVEEDPLTSFKNQLVKWVETELQPRLLNMAMESIATAMGDIKLHIAAEMNAAKNELKQQVAQLVEETISNKLATVGEHLRAREELLDNKLHEVASSQEALERKSLSTNMVMFGLLESSGEDCASQVKSLIGSEGIVDVTRMGKFDTKAKHPRPILIKFSSIAAKHAAFKKAKALREKKIRMDDQLTHGQREGRTRKQPWATTLRQEGWTTFWRGDTLYKTKGQGRPIKVESPPTNTGASSSHNA